MLLEEGRLFALHQRQDGVRQVTVVDGPVPMTISVGRVGPNASSMRLLLLPAAQRGDRALDGIRHILAGVTLLKKPQRQVAVAFDEHLGQPNGMWST